ncbi:MAG: S9 family peptidase [Pyrinomonadaceae bacterium]
MKILVAVLTFILIISTLAQAQTGEIVPGDNLVVEGIPKIQAALVEKINRYTEFRAAGLLSWHPTRREMLIATRFSNSYQVHRLKFPGGARTQLTFFPERITGASYQPTKGDYFIFGKDNDGNEFTQLYRYDLASGDVTLLTDGKSRNTDPVWSSAGDRVVYGSTRRNGKDVDLYIQNPSDTASARLLAQVEGGNWTVLDWSPDDRQMLVLENISVNESYLWTFDTTSGQKTLLTPKGGAEKVALAHGRFSKDGKGIYLTTDRDSEFQRLAYYDLASKQYSFLTEGIKWDVEEFSLSKDGRTIAFTTNEDGISSLHLLSTASRRELKSPALPVGLIENLAWHNNGRELGFSMVAARSTSDIFSLDMKTGKVERWTESETGGLNTANFSEPELVRWKSFDGKIISGFLYLPSAKFTGKRPVLINIHGGPESQARPVFLGRNNYFLNDMGVALLYPNVRGSSGYGKTFLTLDNGFRREDSYKDIGALLDWIKTRPELDASRIMVTGSSYGGHMAFAIATNYSDRIRAALPVVGISNIVSFLEHTEAYRRDLRRAEYGDERDPKMREFLERIAPLNNVQKISVPLFVVQGANDPRVPRNEAEQMVAKIRSNGTPVWFLMAKDEGHGFTKKKNLDFQFYSMIEFMRQYLLK